MKKSLLFIAFAAGMVTMVGCTHEKGWKKSDRDELRKELRISANCVMTGM